ncbi:hypothetical protein O0D78_10485 [Staphylococcus pseudintermedius]|uniref:hypothetical protein n=1 Tax=Staphylococcus pseudintermedius TaxID=283734 RepID=UPI000D7270E4|nr:hypothetical protein [Staphylococcus pseudintermedius]EGQ0289156.1 hypothetical protein [Staphylococcus pseudintermedius]EGQ0326605.1 hypothetical protein [Staphylococcus pseudintermedius]EGQ1284845.1 hypothetical protein [Staphylococcus pseudintermedius]EGQ1599836.1 hypothetical protein [Staphylococcus pseudintermedius]EGQ1613714.1 hypothetical protein [Staphylococcus pseudintermedius]
MNIKVKKEMNLLELIEYIKKNEIADKVFFDNKGKGKVVVGDDRYLYMTDLNLTDTFTVETVEEITEDTVIPFIVELYTNNHGLKETSMHLDNTISNILSINKILMRKNSIFYMINDDATMTLIWKDGELVE